MHQSGMDMEGMKDMAGRRQGALADEAKANKTACTRQVTLAGAGMKVNN